MKRYLLDTGIAGDFISRRHRVDQRARKAMQSGDRVGICHPVPGELWGGMELSTSRDRNMDRMRHALSKLRVWPFDMKAAREYGRVFAELRRIGRKIQQVDMQFVAIARTLGNCIVVSKDADFRAVPGLDVENWACQAT
jgi:tRNA(fMet)-specific endonuclease VapC